MTTSDPAGAAGMTIDAIVARIAAAHQRLLDAIAPLSAAQLQAPAAGSGWSVKDVLAHLSFWDQRLLHAIEPEGGPQASRLAPALIADIPFDEQWLSAVNERIYRRNRRRALSDVLAEFAATRSRLLAVAAGLSLHDVYDPDGLSALLGEPFAPMLLGAYEHYEEHAEALEAAHMATAAQELPRRMVGDFIVTAQVVRGEGAAARSPAGWVACAGVAADVPAVSAVLNGDGSAALQVRRTAGGAVEQGPALHVGADVVQLERRGRTWILSAARFGEPFSACTLDGIEIGDALEVGLSVGAPAGDERAGAAVTFQNVRVVKPAGAGFDRTRDPFGSRLELLDVASGRREVIYEADFVLEAPNWTRDGEALIYNSGGRLYRFDLAERRAAVIDSGDAIRNNNDHVISFDGTQLGISSHDERGDSRVHVMPLTGGQPRRVTPGGHSFLHGWSPDGQCVVYTGYRNGVFDIYRIGVDGGDEMRLTSSPGLDDGPEYTPDGQFIYFNSTRSGRMQIWRMRADGSQQEQVTDDDCDNWFPHISPDGRQVVFLSYLPGEVEAREHPPARRVYLRLMPLAGGAARVIAYLYGGQGTINVPSWSPDSSRIAFVSNTVPYR